MKASAYVNQPVLVGKVCKGVHSHYSKVQLMPYTLILVILIRPLMERKVANMVQLGGDFILQ